MSRATRKMKLNTAKPMQKKSKVWLVANMRRPEAAGPAPFKLSSNKI